MTNSIEQAAARLEQLRKAGAFMDDSAPATPAPAAPPAHAPAAAPAELPVLVEGKQLVGVIDESDILLPVHEDASRFSQSVSSVMTDKLQTLAPGASLTELEAVLSRGLVAIIADASGFHGLITRVDLLNHLRRSLA